MTTCDDYLDSDAPLGHPSPHSPYASIGLAWGVAWGLVILAGVCGAVAWLA